MARVMNVQENSLAEEHFSAARKLIEGGGDKRDALELLQEAAASGHAGALYALGSWHLHGCVVEKNESEGLRLILEAAQKLEPNALYDAAVAYEEGRFLHKNLRKAFDMYLTAALLGERQSVYEAGRMLYYGIGVKKNERVARVFLSLADKLGLD